MSSAQLARLPLFAAFGPALGAPTRGATWDAVSSDNPGISVLLQVSHVGQPANRAGRPEVALGDTARALRGQPWQELHAVAGMLVLGLVLLLSCLSVLLLLWCRRRSNRVRRPRSIEALEFERQRMRAALTDVEERARELRKEISAQRPVAESESQALQQSKGLVRAVEKGAAGTASRAVETAARIVERSDELGREAQQELEESRAEAEALVTERARAFQQALDDEPLPDEALQKWVALEADLPPVQLIFAGLVAPLQLQALLHWNGLLLLLTLPVAAAMFAAAVWDYDKPCTWEWFGLSPWGWFYGAVGLLTASLLARFVVYHTAALSMARLQRKPPQAAGLPSKWLCPSWLRGIGHLHSNIAEFSREFFLALQTYDDLVGRSAYRALSWLTLACVIWGGAFTIENLKQQAGKESRGCQASAMILASHCYCFLYVASLLGAVLTLLVWAAGLAAADGPLGLGSALLHRAHRLDNALMPWGAPLAQLLLRGLLFRGKRDAVILEAHVLRREAQTLAERLSEAQSQERAAAEALRFAEQHLDAATQRLHEDTKLTPEDLAASSERNIQAMVDRAALVGLAAQGIAQTGGQVAMAELRKQMAAAQKLAGASVQELSLRARELAGAVYEGASEGEFVQQAREVAAALDEVVRQKARGSGVDGGHLRQEARDAAGELTTALLLWAQEAGVDVGELAEEAASPPTPLFTGPSFAQA